MHGENKVKKKTKSACLSCNLEFNFYKFYTLELHF
jgi:hypothetical protein